MSVRLGLTGACFRLICVKLIQHDAFQSGYTYVFCNRPLTGIKQLLQLFFTAKTYSRANFIVELSVRLIESSIRKGLVKGPRKYINGVYFVSWDSVH